MSSLGSLGDAVALLSGIDNHNWPQYSSQPLQSLGGGLPPIAVPLTE